jgi:hypothetical protein
MLLEHLVFPQRVRLAMQTYIFKFRGILINVDITNMYIFVVLTGRRISVLIDLRTQKRVAVYVTVVCFVLSVSCL